MAAITPLAASTTCKLAEAADRLKAKPALFIWSEEYRMVVYIPAEAGPTCYLSICLWMIPGCHQED